MSNDSANGNEPPAKPWLQLSIKIANPGDAPQCAWEDRDLDAVMNALDTVRRHIEAQWRMDKAKQLTRTELQAAADTKLAQDLLSRRM